MDEHIASSLTCVNNNNNKAPDSSVPTLFVVSPLLTGAAQRRRGRAAIAQAATAEAANNALRSQKTSVTGDTEFFSLYEEELRGTRPDRLAGVRPQVRVLQRTVEQIVDPVPLVPLLHGVEPQMEEQLVDVLSPYDLQVPEQGIEVPKIINEDILSRRSCREPQLAEQLAEVPTILYFFKQNVDTPVPRRGGVEGQQGFLPGQGSLQS